MVIVDASKDSETFCSMNLHLNATKVHGAWKRSSSIFSKNNTTTNHLPEVFWVQSSKNTFNIWSSTVWGAELWVFLLFPLDKCQWSIDKRMTSYFSQICHDTTSQINEEFVKQDERQWASMIYHRIYTPLEQIHIKLHHRWLSYAY